MTTSNLSNSYNNIFIIHIHFILQDQIELQGDSNLVTKTLNTKCGRLLSSSSNKLHQAYKKLVQSHGADYARSHPPKNATLELWTKVIDGRWANEDWLVNYLCIYYYYPMFTILCCQMIRLIHRWSKYILFYSWSNKYLECSLLEKKSRNNFENRKKTLGKHRCGTKALAVRVDEEVRFFFHFLKP